LGLRDIPRHTNKQVLSCMPLRIIYHEVGVLQKEIKKALDVADEQPEGVAYMIPVRLEECDMPTRLRRWQRVDLFKEDGYPKLVRVLNPRSSDGQAEPSDVIAPSAKNIQDSDKPAADRAGQHLRGDSAAPPLEVSIQPVFVVG
jgi:hypothetical protein